MKIKNFLNSFPILEPSRKLVSKETIKANTVSNYSMRLLGQVPMILQVIKAGFEYYRSESALSMPFRFSLLT